MSATEDGFDTISYTPVVTAEGDPYVAFTWGDKHGKFTIDDARNAGYAILETAALAEVEAAMYRYLLSGAEATQEGAAKIIQAFRHFRLDEQLAAEDQPFVPEATA